MNYASGLCRNLVGVVLLGALSFGCIPDSFDVNVQLGLDPCVTSYPECSPDGGAYCVDPGGDIDPDCHVACLFGLEPVEGCPLEGACFNEAAGQQIDTPIVCTRL